MNGRIFPVIVKKKRIRNMYMRLKEDGVIYITCPMRTTHKDIQKFLEEKRTWLSKAAAHEEITEAKHETGADAPYAVWFGRKMSVKKESGTRNTIRVKEQEIVYTVTDNSPEMIDILFYKAAGKQIVSLILEMRKPWDSLICEPYGKQYPRITVRNMKSRWGSCTPVKGHISISCRLGHYPLGCLQYVLLHEYVHLLVPNHSKEFYDTVAHFMPDWKYYSDLLK